jgi:hypothetical protein
MKMQTTLGIGAAISAALAQSAASFQLPPPPPCKHPFDVRPAFIHRDGLFPQSGAEVLADPAKPVYFAVVPADGSQAYGVTILGEKVSLGICPQVIDQVIADGCWLPFDPDNVDDWNSVIGGTVKHGLTFTVSFGDPIPFDLDEQLRDAFFAFPALGAALADKGQAELRERLDSMGGSASDFTVLDKPLPGSVAVVGFRDPSGKGLTQGTSRPYHMEIHQDGRVWILSEGEIAPWGPAPTSQQELADALDRFLQMSLQFCNGEPRLWEIFDPATGESLYGKGVTCQWDGKTYSRCEECSGVTDPGPGMYHASELDPKLNAVINSALAAAAAEGELKRVVSFRSYGGGSIPGTHGDFTVDVMSDASSWAVLADGTRVDMTEGMDADGKNEVLAWAMEGVSKRRIEVFDPETGASMGDREIRCVFDGKTLAVYEDKPNVVARQAAKSEPTFDPALV